MIICGIDPSLTGTAVVLSDPAAGPEGYKIKRFSSEPHDPSCVKSRMARFEDLVGRIDKFLADNHVTHVLIENYSFASKFNVTLLGEFGGILRWHLATREFVAEVAPTTLKKFVTGRGDAKGKSIIGSHMTARWGVLFDNDDLQDAYCLWRLGRCCIGIDEPDTQARREAVGKVMGFEVPKEPKPRNKPEPKPF